MVAGLVSRKADAFASLLDGTDAGGASNPALAHMASLTQRLAAVPGPSAPFKAALRDQLISAASHSAATAAPSAAGATHSLLQGGHAAGSSGAAGSGASSAASTLATLGKSAPLWVKLFAGSMAVAVSATGVGVGAHRALPGDFFYGIKRQVEAVQLDLASGAREKATTQLGFAHARTDELAELIKRDHVSRNAHISDATTGHIRGLLQDWAGDAGEATTSLLSQIRGLGSKSSTAALSAELRKTLQTFAAQQFVQLGGLLDDLPTGSSVQTLTVSALGYLQRVDTVLGGNPTALVNQLPVPLSSIPGLSGIATQLNLPSGSSSTGTGSTGTGASKGSGTTPVPLPSGGTVQQPGSPLPTTVPHLPLPTTLPQVPLPTTGPGGIHLPLPSTGGVLPSTGVGGLLGNGGGTGSSKGGSTGNVGKTVGGAVNGVGKSVSGAVGTVTGGLTSNSGPSLSLPSALPTLPALPPLPHLP